MAREAIDDMIVLILGFKDRKEQYTMDVYRRVQVVTAE